MGAPLSHKDGRALAFECPSDNGAKRTRWSSWSIDRKPTVCHTFGSRHPTLAKSFADFSAFVAFLPGLIAGPIIRSKTLAGQLTARSHTLSRFASGALVSAIGFAKTILLAHVVLFPTRALYALAWSCLCWRFW